MIKALRNRGCPHTHTHTNTHTHIHTCIHTYIHARSFTTWAPVTPRHFAWQAWHNLTSTLVSRGRRGTKSHPPSFCVARAWDRWHWVARLVPAWAPVTPRHFVWQAWHNLTSTLVSRARRGTKSHPPSFCVAGVGQMALGGALGPAWAPVIHFGFTWQAWHKVTSTVVLRGRRGTDGTGWRAWSGLGACDAAALCVAQPDIHLGFTWQAWHKVTSTVVLRGRRGTDGTGWRAWSGLGACDAAALCVAGVAQPDIHLGFTWQAWHKVTSTVVLRGRRETDGTGWRAWSGLGACDAAPDIHLGFTWQAWHKVTSTVVLRGRRGTDGTGWRAWSGLGACDAAALCVAGVAQPDIHLGFTWQAWHKVTSTVVLRGRGWHKLTSTIVLRGRRGTDGTGWGTVVLRGRRGTTSHPPLFCVAGVALMALGGAWTGLVARDTHTHTPAHTHTHTWPSFCVAGVALMALGGAWTGLVARDTHTHIHTYIHTCIHTYIHARSFTTSFVFPSFPVPAETIEAHFRKKLTCGLSGPLIDVFATWKTI